MQHPEGRLGHPASELLKNTLLKGGRFSQKRGYRDLLDVLDGSTFAK